MLCPSNFELQSLIYNYIKCNAMLSANESMTIESYRSQGLQQSFLRNDEKSIKLFTVLSKMQSPLAKEFFEERQKAEAMFE